MQPPRGNGACHGSDRIECRQDIVQAGRPAGVVDAKLNDLVTRFEAAGQETKTGARSISTR